MHSMMRTAWVGFACLAFIFSCLSPLLPRSLWLSVLFLPLGSRKSFRPANAAENTQFLPPQSLRWTLRTWLPACLPTQPTPRSSGNWPSVATPRPKMRSVFSTLPATRNRESRGTRVTPLAGSPRPPSTAVSQLNPSWARSTGVAAACPRTILEPTSGPFLPAPMAMPPARFSRHLSPPASLFPNARPSNSKPTSGSSSTNPPLNPSPAAKRSRTPEAGRPLPLPGVRMKPEVVRAHPPQCSRRASPRSRTRSLPEAREQPRALLRLRTLLPHPRRPARRLQSSLQSRRHALCPLGIHRRHAMRSRREKAILSRASRCARLQFRNAGLRSALRLLPELGHVAGSARSQRRLASAASLAQTSRARRHCPRCEDFGQYLQRASHHQRMGGRRVQRGQSCRTSHRLRLQRQRHSSGSRIRAPLARSVQSRSQEF